MWRPSRWGWNESTMWWRESAGAEPRSTHSAPVSTSSGFDQPPRSRSQLRTFPRSTDQHTTSWLGLTYESRASATNRARLGPSGP